MILVDRDICFLFLEPQHFIHSILSVDIQVHTSDCQWESSILNHRDECILSKVILTNC
jgi:hypothetical protein